LLCGCGKYFTHAVLCLLKGEGKSEAASAVEQDFRKDSEILEQRPEKPQKIDFPFMMFFFETVYNLTNTNFTA
jgi:hypothetical protein